MSDAGRRFRAILAEPGITVLPGVFNGFSARLVQEAGYRAAAISGAGISESLLGWADRGILTFDQNLRAGGTASSRHFYAPGTVGTIPRQTCAVQANRRGPSG